MKCFACFSVVVGKPVSLQSRADRLAGTDGDSFHGFAKKSHISLKIPIFINDHHDVNLPL